MIECFDCGLVQEEPPLERGQWAACARCGSRLAIRRSANMQVPLALSMTAVILLMIAAAMPFLDFTLRGRRADSRWLSGIDQLWQTGFEGLAALVAVTVVVAPLFVFGGLIAVLLPLTLGRCPSYAAGLFRTISKFRPWAMLEVFLLGVLVAVVKLGDLASVGLDVAFYALALLALVGLAAWESIDPRCVWATIDRLSPRADSSLEGTGRPAVGCPACGLRVGTSGPEDRDEAEPRRCPRCRERLHRRKPHALQRSLALLLAAALLYLPANLLPVMRLDLLGREQADTILEGVQSLIAGGLWEIAALVFFASFLVPGLKIFGLSYLAWSVHRPNPARRAAQTRLFRVIDQIGRWSMIDVFMTAVLVGLVQLGAIATIVPGAGANCFAAVVVLTIFAARAFDPRALWDRAGETDG